MTTAQHLDIARSSLLLKSVPDQFVKPILAEAYTRKFDRGETVFVQGDIAQSIHIVIDGWVKLYRIAHSGNEAVVSVFTKGSSFGEAVALRAMEYPVSCEAVTDCTLLHVPAHTIVSQMKDEPELCTSVLASVFIHLHSLVEQIEQIKALTGAQRVAEFLLELCNCDTGSCVVTLPYEKTLIAGRLGMKPESLSRAFSRLRKIGVETLKNHASIKDVALLRDYVEEDTSLTASRAG